MLTIKPLHRPLHRLGLLILFDLQYALARPKGLFFLLPFIAFWGFVIYHFDRQVSVWLQQQGFVFIASLIDFETAARLFIDNAPLLSLYFIFNMNAMPLYAVLAAHDQFASDVGSGYFRLLHSRCSRLEIFLARYLAALALLLIGLGGMGMALALVIIGSGHVEQAVPGILANTLAYLLTITIKLMAYAASLVAFMAVFSALAPSPLAALLLGGGAYVALLVIFIVTHTHQGTAWFACLLPNAFKPALLNTEPAAALPGLAAMPAYMAAYGALAWWIFRRRNL